MPWQLLTLRLAAAELPETEALLRLIGAHSIAISDDDDAPILEPAPGTTPLWPTLTVQALFDADVDLTGIARIVSRDAQASIEPIADRDWLAAVRQTITPIRIAPGLRIVPAEDYAGGADELGLNMGLAFGTGRHPTTRLCLEWLARHPPAGLDVLDFGAGTGVLALAALKLGAKRAFAVDSEPQALEAVRRNAALNALADTVWIGAPESLPERKFDLILANILAEPLIELASAFAERQRPGARIVLSGLLSTQADAIEEAYAEDYEHFARREADGWCLVTAALV